MRPLLVAICALSASGCVSPRAVLVNDRGEYLTCAASAAGLIGSAVAQNRYEDCVSEAKEKGYRIVSQQQ